MAPPSNPEPKSRLRYLLHDHNDQITPAPQPPVPIPIQPLAHPPTAPTPSVPPQPSSLSSTPTTPSARLQALNLAAVTPTSTSNSGNSNSNSVFRLPPLPSPPNILPVRARSADSAIVHAPFANPNINDTELKCLLPQPPRPPPPPQSVRSDSAISDVTTTKGALRNSRDNVSFSSGPSFSAIPGPSTSSLTANTSPSASYMQQQHMFQMQIQQQQQQQQHMMQIDRKQQEQQQNKITSIEGQSIQQRQSLQNQQQQKHQEHPQAFGSGSTTFNPTGIVASNNANAGQIGSGSVLVPMNVSVSGHVPHTPMHQAVSSLLPSRRNQNNSNNNSNNIKTEAELRDKREMRRMKNRISAARSRQRKTDTFETLQRELAEAKTVIESLTKQLDRFRGARDHSSSQVGGTPSAPPAPLVIAVPQDLRPVVGRDFVSVDMLMDVLRLYIRRAQQKPP